MADQNDDIIINIKIKESKEDVENRVKSLNGFIKALRTEEAALNAELKKGVITQNEYAKSQTSIKTQLATFGQQLEKGKKTLAEYVDTEERVAKAQRQATANLAMLTPAQKAHADSTKNVQQRIKELSAEFATEEAAIKSTTSSMDKLNASSDKIGATGASVKNAGKGIKDYLRDLNVMGINVGQTEGQFKKGFDAAQVFAKGIATTRGGLIALGSVPILLFLTGLIAFFKSTDEGADKLEQTINGLKEGFNSLSKSIAPLGKRLYDAFFNRDEFLKKLKAGTDEYNVSLGDVAGNALRAGQAQVAYTKTMQDVEDAEDELTKQRAQTNLTVDQALLKVKDRTLSEKQRIAILDNAGKAESDLAAKTLGNAKTSLAALVALNKERSKGRELTDDERKAQYQAEAAVINAERESLNTQQAIKNRRSALVEQDAADQKQRAADAKEAAKAAAQDRVYEAQLAILALKKAGQQTQQVEEEIIRRQAAVEIVGLKKNSNQRSLILTKAESDILDLRVKTALEAATRLNTLKADEIKTLLTVVKEGTISELELNKALIEAEAKQEKDQAAATIKNKEELDSKIRLIDAETKKKLLSADKAFLEKQIQLNNDRAAVQQKVADDLLSRFTKDQAKRDKDEKDTKEKREKDEDEEAEKRRKVIEAVTAAAESAVSISSQLMESINQRLLDQLDVQQTAALNSAGTNADLREKIEENFAKKRLKLEKKQAEDRRKIALVEGVIQGAKSVLEASPNVALMIIAGATAVAQLAIISQQKFASGGVYKSDGRGDYVRGPGTGTSDSINARISNKESIINAKSTEKYYDLLSAINSDNGNGRVFPNANKQYASTTLRNSILPKYSLTPSFAQGGVQSFAQSQPAVDVQQLANLIGVEVQVALAQQTPPVLVVSDLHSVEADITRLNRRTSIKVGG